jgi:hypothetical protein
MPRRQPRPRWWSSLVPRPRLGGPPWPHRGAPHETFIPIKITTAISKTTTVISKTTALTFSNYGLNN